MSALPSRLEKARTHLGLSQQDLAGSLGVTQATYSSWELGKTSPKATYLENLCTFGFNGHWLLTGHGEMLTEAQPQKGGARAYTPRQVTKEADPDIYEQPSDHRELMLKEELRNLRESGLDKLFLLSQRGSQAGLWRVLKALGTAGSRLSLTELHKAISEDGEAAPRLEHVAADAELLRLQKMVSATEEGAHVFYEMTPDARMRPGSHVDMLQAVREAVRSLGIEILPALRRRDQSGWMANTELWVPDGPAFVAKLRALVIEELQAAHGDGQRVYVLVAAGADVPTESDKPW